MCVSLNPMLPSSSPRTDPRADKGKGYMFQRTESLPLELPEEGTLRPKRPKLQRSQSEIVDTTRSTTTSPSGPPDITAIDLSDDRIHRAYSQADVHSQRSKPMPPLGQMTGFGKYRRSIHANPEWQMQQYRSNLRDFPGLVPHLGEFKLADPDPVVWDQFCQESARSNSFASSKTSHSNSSECPTDGNTDRRTGPVVIRGFVPSTTSSAASSFRDSSSGHTRKDSGMSMTSPSGESENKLVRFTSRQSTLSLLGEPTTLTSINEDLAGDRQQAGKVSQILRCNIKGDTENAVESDYEDEPGDSATQLGVAQGGIHGTSPQTLRIRDIENTKLTQIATIERAKRRDSSQHKPRDYKSGLERSTTVIRKPVKPVLRRTSSRGKPLSSKRAVKLENAPITGKKVSSAGPKPQELVSYALTSSDESTEVHEHLGDLGLYMAGAKNSTIYQLVEKEDPAKSFESSSTMHTVAPENISTLPTKSAIQPRRNRSDTAIRIVSEPTQV
jgi:hypothetical protein